MHPPWSRIEKWMSLTIVIPFWNGHKHIDKLLKSLPGQLSVIVVDDQSDTLYKNDNAHVIRPSKRGYFSGAVNAGIQACNTDVLVLNQDIWFTSNQWLDELAKLKTEYALIGDGVMGHPAHQGGYVQGTFMFMRRDAIDKVGLLNEQEYPLWGATCEWQIRACRAGFKVQPSHIWRQWFQHSGRHGGNGRQQQFGDAISEAIKREKKKAWWFTRTPPAISVVVPCYNYGRYLPDAINSLIGGETCLGYMPKQTFQSFEIVIVDDTSTDNSLEMANELADDWKAIRVVALDENRGTPGCINAGIEASYGEFIHILSADDMREPKCLEKLYAACRRNKDHFAYPDVTVLRDGKRTKRLRMPDFDLRRLLYRNLAPAGIMYPKSAWAEIGGYPEEMRYGREDWAFNVALALNGYCGVHVKESLNLYRREKQNRSLRTGNRHQGEAVADASGFDWRKLFVQQMRALYPEAYENTEAVTQMCCGKRGVKKVKKTVPIIPKSLPGAKDGLVMLEYIGDNVGFETFRSTVTPGTRYEFGDLDGYRLGYVDPTDVKRLLALRNKAGRSLFKRYIRKAVLPVPPKEVVHIANPVETTRGRLAKPEIALEPTATRPARVLAEQNGLDVSIISGSGKDGKVIKSDVEEYLGRHA